MRELAARHGIAVPVSAYCRNLVECNCLRATAAQYVFFVDVENTLEIWWKDSNSSHETPSHPTNLWVNSKSAQPPFLSILMAICFRERPLTHPLDSLRLRRRRPPLLIPRLHQLSRPSVRGRDHSWLQH